MERRRLLLTRPEAAAQRFLQSCEAHLGETIPAILSPILAIQPVEVRLEEVPAALILTSENGARRAGELGLAGLRAWCVGPRTAAAAGAAGLLPIEAGPEAESLLARLLREPAQGTLLHLRGEHTRGDLAARLCASGIPARDAVAYRQDPCPPTPEARAALDGARPLVVPLFSPRSAALLAGWAPGAPLHVVALSPAVATASEALHPSSLVTSPRPDGEAMIGPTLSALGRVDGPRLEPADGAD